MCLDKARSIAREYLVDPCARQLYWVLEGRVVSLGPISISTFELSHLLQPVVVATFAFGARILVASGHIGIVLSDRGAVVRGGGRVNCLCLPTWSSSDAGLVQGLHPIV